MTPAPHGNNHPPHAPNTQDESTESSKRILTDEELRKAQSNLSITQGELILLQHLCKWYRSDRPLPSPSNGYLAKSMAKSPRTVQRLKQSLQQKNLIRVYNRFRESAETSSFIDLGPLLDRIKPVKGGDTPLSATVNCTMPGHKLKTNKGGVTNKQRKQMSPQGPATTTASTLKQENKRNVRELPIYITISINGNPVKNLTDHQIHRLLDTLLNPNNPVTLLSPSPCQKCHAKQNKEEQNRDLSLLLSTAEQETLFSAGEGSSDDDRTPGLRPGEDLMVNSLNSYNRGKISGRRDRRLRQRVARKPKSEALFNKYMSHVSKKATSELLEEQVLLNNDIHTIDNTYMTERYCKVGYKDIKGKSQAEESHSKSKNHSKKSGGKRSISTDLEKPPASVQDPSGSPGENDLKGNRSLPEDNEMIEFYREFMAGSISEPVTKHEDEQLIVSEPTVLKNIPALQAAQSVLQGAEKKAKTSHQKAREKRLQKALRKLKATGVINEVDTKKISQLERKELVDCWAQSMRMYHRSVPLSSPSRNDYLMAYQLLKKLPYEHAVDYVRFCVRYWSGITSVYSRPFRIPYLAILLRHRESLLERYASYLDLRRAVEEHRATSGPGMDLMPSEEMIKYKDQLLANGIDVQFDHFENT